MNESTTTRILAGFAEWLRGHGVADWDRDGGPAYTAATEWPQYIGPAVPPTPHALLVLTAGVRSQVRGTVEQSVQIRGRGIPDGPASIIDDKLQQILALCSPNGFPRTAVTLGSIRVGLIRAGDLAPLGTDPARRHEAVLNVTIRYRQPLH